MSIFMNRMATFNVGGKNQIVNAADSMIPQALPGCKRAMQSRVSPEICLCTFTVLLQLCGRRWPALPASKKHLLSQSSKIPVIVNYFGPES